MSDYESGGDESRGGQNPGEYEEGMWPVYGEGSHLGDDCVKAVTEVVGGAVDVAVGVAKVVGIAAVAAAGVSLIDDVFSIFD